MQRMKKIAMRLSLEPMERDFWPIHFWAVFRVRYCIEPENRFLSSRCRLRKPAPSGMESDGIVFNCHARYEASSLRWIIQFLRSLSALLSICGKAHQKQANWYDGSSSLHQWPTLWAESLTCRN